MDLLLKSWSEVQKLRQNDKFKKKSWFNNVLITTQGDSYYAKVKITSEEILIQPLTPGRLGPNFGEDHLSGCNVEGNKIILNFYYNLPSFEFSEFPNALTFNHALQLIRNILRDESSNSGNSMTPSPEEQ